MKRAGKWAVGILITAATATAVLTTVSNPGVEAPITADTVSIFDSGVTEEAGVSPSPQGNCGYQWASHDAPELTKSFDADVKALNPEASARAEYFGEDCVYTDGTSTFGAMETDFYVRLPVEDLSKEEEFGNWISQVMEYVTQIPREDLQGPNYGFVEFWFEKSEAEHIAFRVPIQQYLDEAQSLTGVELFRKFNTPP